MGRYLKRNCGTEAPSRLIFVDTESYQEDRSDVVKKTANRLRLWVAVTLRLEKGEVTRRKEEHGLTADSFWKFVDENSDAERCTWIFAHHLCYDLTQLKFWHELDQGRFVTTPMKSKSLGTDGQLKNSWIGKLCLEDSPFWIQVRNGRRTYKMVDTFNYWQCPLSVIAKSVGMEQEKCDFANATVFDLLKRCQQDTYILERAVCLLIKKWTEADCGVFQPTAASLAMTNFRHECPIRLFKSGYLDLVTQPNCVQNVLERESYFGGRIQAFFVGELHHKIYHLDCNSLYPYVMQKYSYPRRFVGFRNGVTLEELEAMSKVYGVCARVRIRSNWNTFPVRIDGKQYHCVGQYWTALCGQELCRAIQDRSVDRIGTVQLYSVAPLFRSWVGKWYQRKVDAERLGDGGISNRMFAKLLLCSLSGKWAQGGRTWKDCPGERSLVRWGGYPERKAGGTQVERVRGIAGNKQVLSDGKEPDHAFPAISAFITAAAREYMRSVINICGEGNVYYMATDSLICNQDAYDNLAANGYIDPEKIGGFKLKGTHRYAAIHGPNDYVLDSEQVVSGHIGKARVGPNGYPVAEIWDRAPTVIASGPRDEIIVTEIPAYYSHHTNRGRIGEDGRWIPYRITDDIDFTDRPRQGSHFASYSLDMEADRIRRVV